MGNKRNRRSRRVEFQFPDRDENNSELSLTQGKATLIDVSENVNTNFANRANSFRKSVIISKKPEIV